LFPEAVTFAIYGYHFRKVCELRLVDDRATLTGRARRRRY
jgi:hypothetical protein